MQGIKKDIVFPKEVYDYIKALCAKMATTPLMIPNPTTGQPQQAINPETKKPLNISTSGTVDEFFHVAVMQSLVGLVSSNPAFMTEMGKLQKIMEVYGEFIQKTLGNNKDAPTKKSR